MPAAGARLSEVLSEASPGSSASGTSAARRGRPTVQRPGIASPAGRDRAPVEGDRPARQGPGAVAGTEGRSRGAARSRQPRETGRLRRELEWAPGLTALVRRLSDEATLLRGELAGAHAQLTILILPWIEIP